MTNKILYGILLIPALIICAPDKKDDAILRRALARATMHHCRQAARARYAQYYAKENEKTWHGEDNPADTVECAMLANFDAKLWDKEVSTKELYDIFYSEHADLLPQYQNESPAFRAAVRECIESGKDLETADSDMRVKSCITAKGFTDLDLDNDVIAEEYARHRILNQQTFDFRKSNLLPINFIHMLIRSKYERAAKEQ